MTDFAIALLRFAFALFGADYSWPDLPDSSGYVNQSDYECNNLPSPKVPTVQSLPTIEPGVRSSRTLPYELYVDATVSDNQLKLTITNSGKAGIDIDCIAPIHSVSFSFSVTLFCSDGDRCLLPHV